MAVNLKPTPADALHAVGGVALGGTYAGVRRASKDDLLVVTFAPGSVAAGVFTRNRFCAAPVTVCREHLADNNGQIRALVINAGNANAGTGERGMADARKTCAELAGLLNCTPADVLPMSTGVILEPLPMDKLLAGLPRALEAATANNWDTAARAIMTTDTVPKAVSRVVDVNGQQVHITGVAKGAGMIRPDMGTMLSFVAMDAAVDPALLQQWIRVAADQSFNRVTVDGDTSTNDSLLAVATGTSGVRIDSADASGADDIRNALFDVTRTLAQWVVRDGEGATKFIAIHVEQAQSRAEASAIAYSIAHSPLVKTAFFASDANLGRLLCAIGYADVPDLDVDRLDLYLGDVLVASNGGRHPDYVEEDGARIMAQDEIDITVRLNRGGEQTTVWTCDLSHDYVRINAEYRT